MPRNVALVTLFFLTSSSCNGVLAQNINDEIKSAGINTCECIRTSKYYSSELVHSVFTACQSKYLSNFKKQDYSSYEFDHFGNPIGELLNSYLYEMNDYCPTQMAEFKKSKRISESDGYVTGKYIKIDQNDIIEEIEFLGECGETYNLVTTINNFAKEILSPLAKEQDMSYYQFVIANTEYPIKLFFKKLEVIDNKSNVKKQINFVTATDTNYAGAIKLQKIMGTYKGNCNQ